MNNNFLRARISEISQKFRQFKKSKKIVISAVVVVVLLIALVLVNAGLNKSNAQSTSTAQKSLVAQPVASETLNRDFSFSVKDKTGKVITTFDYKILDAQLIDQVIINGQKYSPVPGKTFLVIDLAITNNYTQTITIAPRDYVRIMMNGSSEKLAPDIYNDPVDVQAISTKPNKLALAVNTTDKNIKLQIGEITGKKTIVPLTLHY